MSIRIVSFEWDAYNMEHLQESHPDMALELLEEIVMSAKEYIRWGSDMYGKKIFGAKHGRLVVLFNLKGKGTARIFSVREVGK